ncbi:MAG TPA: hypothetical protein VJS12_08895 [Steroidobacteraceae bacterium]|nr:hypothetical protein [Steroidobacteraceae bacterium]
MRKRTALEPRLMALSEAELVALHKSRSWIPQSAPRAAMDPTRWSQRAQQERYWRMVDIWTQLRTVH